MRTHYLSSPIGYLQIDMQQDYLVSIQSVLNQPQHFSCMTVSDGFKLIVDELETYFQNPTYSFSSRYHLTGTAFQKTVWQALTEIPPGHSISYGELAKQLHTSPRAIGNACRMNRILLMIPCHRVIGKNNLGGFAGDTDGRLLKIKQWLLQHEAL